MSDEWVQPRMERAVDVDILDEIDLNGYERKILRVNKFGDVSEEKL